MPRGPVFRPGVTDDTGLAQARERFLTAESVEPGRVRDTIMASWRRCREWHVAADRIDLSYVRDPDLDTPLTRNALPVLQNLYENLEGQPISVILTDAHGVALSRLTADHDLDRHLAGKRPGGARVRARALRRAPGGPRLRRGADPPPDLRQGHRRGEPDLLAQRRRPTADRARPEHRRADHAGAAQRRQRAGVPAAAGVSAGLPAHWRDRFCANQRHGADERP